MKPKPAGFVLRVRHDDPQVQEKPLQAYIAEILFFAVVFSKSLQYYFGFYGKLHNFSNQNCANLTVYSNEKIINQLAFGLYLDAE